MSAVKSPTEVKPSFDRQQLTAEDVVALLYERLPISTYIASKLKERKMKKYTRTKVTTLRTLFDLNHFRYQVTVGGTIGHNGKYGEVLRISDSLTEALKWYNAE